RCEAATCSPCPIQGRCDRSARYAYHPGGLWSASPAAPTRDQAATGSSASAALGGRSGISREPPEMRSVARSGEGQIIGQYAVERASLTLWPAGNTEPASLSLMRTR